MNKLSFNNCAKLFTLGLRPSTYKGWYRLIHINDYAIMVDECKTTKPSHKKYKMFKLLAPIFTKEDLYYSLFPYEIEHLETMEEDDMVDLWIQLLGQNFIDTVWSKKDGVQYINGKRKFTENI